LKGIDYEQLPINLRAGDQNKSEFIDIQPQGFVPALRTDDEDIIIQSPAILEYLDEIKPEPPFFPADVVSRANARAMAAIIGCDIHPVNNLRILNTLRSEFKADEDDVIKWCGKWISAGFTALETILGLHNSKSPFVFGDRPGIVEIYLIPQVYSAGRFDVSLNPFPKILDLNEACAELEAFQKAHPSVQPDSV